MPEETQDFVLRGRDAEARGTLTEDGFLVKAGAIARKEIVPSAVGSVTPVRERLISEGVLEPHEGQFRFTQDYLFDSPSGAAGAVLGRTSNGWIDWKTEDGRTLNDAKRSTISGGLDPVKRTQIIEKYQQLFAEEKLLTEQQLTTYSNNFRERFGPGILAKLSGEDLLELMHDHSNRDSLVYWLEFKNDDEFITRRFGSIAGGSALKFGIFRRKETGNWQAGDSSNRPTDISVDEAIEIATRHIDQLLKGVEILAGLPASGSDEDYGKLQERMDELAPDVSDLAWGHKYFSMMSPDKLDDYHSPKWQRFHILKLLQMPPEGKGRYVSAGRFIAACNEVSLPVVVFDTVLNAIHGGRHDYWRIGTRSGSTNESHWQMMQDRNCVAIGWNKLGDLSWVEAKKFSRVKLKKLLTERHPNHHTTIGKACTQITHYIAKINEGDIIWAARGATILGVGRIVGEYEYHEEFDFPPGRLHRKSLCGKYFC